MATTLSDYFEKEIAGVYASVFSQPSATEIGTDSVNSSHSSIPVSAKKRYVNMKCEVFDMMQEVLSGMDASAFAMATHKRRYDDILAFEKENGVKSEPVACAALSERELVKLKDQLAKIDKVRLLSLLASAGIDATQRVLDLRLVEKEKLRRLLYVLQKEKESAFAHRDGMESN